MPLSLKFQGPMLTDNEIYLFAIHTIFMAITVMGAILLIVWMSKNLKPKQLLTWLVIFIVVGLLGSFATFRQEMDFVTKAIWGGSISGTWSSPSQ